MALTINEDGSKRETKNTNRGFVNSHNSVARAPVDRRKQHQMNAEQGKYGKDFKDINEARKKKQQLIDDFLNN